MSYSHNLLVALGERGVPFVLCGSNHLPVAVLTALDGHHLQAKRIDAQLAASLPIRERLWADIVRSKLAQQAATLSAVGAASAPLMALVAHVRSGDPANLEAQGARRYWGLLMGEGFSARPDRRWRQQPAELRLYRATRLHGTGGDSGRPAPHTRAAPRQRR